MELQKQIQLYNKYNISLTDSYLDYFYKAKQFTFDNYIEDFNRIANTKFNNVDSYFFCKEMTWCIAVSGFNAKIVSKFFPNLMSILDPMFNDIANGKWQYWDEYSYTLDKDLLKIFNNKRKINAITYNTIELISRGIKKNGWELYRDNELNSPEKLEKFEMVGPAISKHLARNLGLLNFVKPDIHLKRLAVNWGFNNPEELCKKIQEKYDMPLGLIDLCLFYAASTFGTK